MNKHSLTLLSKMQVRVSSIPQCFRVLFASIFILLAAQVTVSAQCQTCCNGSKPKSLVLLYNGKTCAQSVTCQAADKWSCSGAGPGNAATVYITVSKNVDGTGGTYFAGTVNLNTEFTANSISGGSTTFPSNTFFNVYSSQGGTLLQAVKIHTSCSTPLVAGDQLGSFKLQKITLADNTVCNAPTPPPPPPTCPIPTITINNSSSTSVGSVCKGQQVVFVTADLGYDCFVYTWNFGSNATPSTATGIGPHTVTYNVTGSATVTLSVDNNCEGGIGSTICPPPPPPPVGSDCCDSNSGKPKSLKIKYTGQSCSTTNTTQGPDKYSCADVGAGPNGASTVYIIANEKADGSGITYFAGTVSLNGTFTATSPSTTLPTNTFFIVKTSQTGTVLQNIKIHTSCSAPIVPGESFGSLLLESATWSTGVTCDINSGSGGGGGSTGPDCCDSNSGKPKSLTMQYNGESCSQTSTSQGPDKYSCADVGAGPNGASTVYIVANEKADGSGITYFAGTVSLGGTFTATSPSTTLPTNTYFIIRTSQGGTILQNIKIHTSCSAPIVPGDQFGSLVLQAATWANGVTCGQVTPPGPDCIDCDQTVTTTFTVQDCNPCDVNLNVSNVVCDGKGTATTADDTYTFTVNVTGTNTSGQWTGSYSNGFIGVAVFGPIAYNTPIVLGPFPAGQFTAYNTFPPTTVQNGLNISVSVSDAQNPNCSDNTTVNSPGPCSTQCVDTDGDNVCDIDDCAPNNPALPTTPGTSCNDGNPNTTNDVIQADGCSCAGTPSGPDCVNGINISVSGNNIVVTGLAGSPVSSLQVFSATWQTVFNCFANCGSSQSLTVPPGTYYVYAKYYTANYQFICEKQATLTVTGPCVDTDSDGVCDTQDCVPNDPQFPATPGTPCNDGNPNTNNDVVTSNGCGCAGTPVTICDNVISGGTIGFGTTCASSASIACNTASPNIINCVSPSGGTGNIEIVWLKSTTSCSFPTSTAAQIAAGLDPHWTMIPGATGLTYNPGVVTQNTCFLRCSRRVGCDVFLESNIISLTTNCGSGTPNCANITITPSAGKITVSGLNGAPISSLQIFSGNWATTLFSCFGNCSATQQVSLPAGTYQVLAKFYNASWQPICEKLQTVTVSSALGSSDQSEAFQFVAEKQEEHTSLYWLHNAGFKVSEYILERSADGSSFEQIDRQASQGGTNQAFYEGYDLEPLEGDNYYRVKMLNADGSITFSDIQKVNFPQLIIFSLFPNPANGFVKANLESVVGATDVTITIFNSFGTEMKRFNLDEVYSKYYQMDIRDLHEGHYIVWINVPGKRPIAKTLVVGRI